MKDVVLRIIVVIVATMLSPVLAMAGHEAHGQTPEAFAAPSDSERVLQQSMNKMQQQMDAVNHATDPEERRRLLKEHNETMRASIKAMREMMGCMAMGGHMDSCHTMHGQPATRSGAEVVAGSAGVEQIAPADKGSSAKSVGELWTCPMHPEVVQDHPGVCPICGMDLVKMDQTGGSRSGHGHMMGGAMKDHCVMEGKKAGMKSSGTKGGKKAAKKDNCMMQGGMMGSCKMDGMAKRTEMMLMLMEQMIEHDDAEISVLK